MHAFYIYGYHFHTYYGTLIIHKIISLITARNKRRSNKQVCNKYPCNKRTFNKHTCNERANDSNNNLLGFGRSLFIQLFHG